MSCLITFCAQVVRILLKKLKHVQVCTPHAEPWLWLFHVIGDVLLGDGGGAVFKNYKHRTIQVNVLHLPS